MDDYIIKRGLSSEGINYYEGDLVEGSIYDGLGEDYGDLLFDNGVIRYNEELGELQILDLSTDLYIDSLSNVLFPHNGSWLKIK